MRRRVFVGIVIVALIAVVGLVLVLIGRGATPLSSVGTSDRPCISAAQACLRFPVITGESLLGQALTLPADFAGESVLVIVPFDENQQVNAQTWLPLAREVALLDADFTYYTVPIFPGMAAPMRALIRGGMSLIIGDADLRAITITVFLDDRDQFLNSLTIPDADAMQVFLLNGDGEMIWRGAGEFSSEQGESLRAALAV